MTSVHGEESILNLLHQREQQCRVEYRAYGRWLALLTPLRWVTVAGGTVLSALAGATIFSRPDFLGEQWPLYAGVFALAASILTGLHTALNCDAHQSECHRLIQLYQSLEGRFQAASVLAPDDLRKGFTELEARFDDARTTAMASPPTYFRDRAERDVLAPS
jgi:hypothetical protein